MAYGADLAIQEKRVHLRSQAWQNVVVEAGLVRKEA